MRQNTPSVWYNMPQQRLQRTALRRMNHVSPWQCPRLGEATKPQSALVAFSTCALHSMIADGLHEWPAPSRFKHSLIHLIHRNHSRKRSRCSTRSLAVCIPSCFRSLPGASEVARTVKVSGSRDSEDQHWLRHETRWRRRSCHFSIRVARYVLRLIYPALLRHPTAIPNALAGCYLLLWY